MDYGAFKMTSLNVSNKIESMTGFSGRIGIQGDLVWLGREYKLIFHFLACTNSPFGWEGAPVPKSAFFSDIWIENGLL
jgi:hypothetical protein